MDLRFPNLIIQEYTVENFRVVGVPQGMKADVITEKLTVRVRGPVTDISKLKAEDITIVVDFTNAQVGTTTYKVQLSFAEGFEGVGVLGKPQITATVIQS